MLMVSFYNPSKYQETSGKRPVTWREGKKDKRKNKDRHWWLKTSEGRGEGRRFVLINQFFNTMIFTKNLSHSISVPSTASGTSSHLSEFLSALYLLYPSCQNSIFTTNRMYKKQHLLTFNIQQPIVTVTE